MSEFDARLDRDSAVLKRAQSIGANPSFILDFAVSIGFIVIGLLTLVCAGMVGWGVFAAIVVGTALVTLTPFGENLPIGICVVLSIAIGGTAVVVASLPGYVTLAVVLLGAVLVLATPNGGNFMLMGMAVLSLGAGIVTLWAAAMAIFGAHG
jgi:hypothetical protein